MCFAMCRNNILPFALSLTPFLSSTVPLIGNADSLYLPGYLSFSTASIRSFLLPTSYDSSANSTIKSNHEYTYCFKSALTHVAT